ncbi:MAG: SOS response-associated peptidase [Methanoregulaceae archaeon]|nr:SOS response-associated peptidase [Methanoregulaceae archaeon]
MCGRFTIAMVIGLHERFRTIPPSFELRPRYNISPSQEVPVIVESPDDSAHREIVMMKWGLVPCWATDIKIGRWIINARADSLISGPAFRYNVQHHRCLIPATGFFEWRLVGKKKIPCYIRRKDGAFFAFAGLYDNWKGPEASIFKTFAIVTTEPNSLVAPLHNRMPAILSTWNEDTWIREGPITESDFEEILIPYPEHELETYRVSSAVNKPDYESPELIRRITESL